MSTEPPFVLIVNPRAAGGRAEGKIAGVERALSAAGGDFVTRRTRGPGDASRLVREAIAEGAAGVAVIGGDGTFSEAINGFFDADGNRIESDAWFAPLPFGTGGDFRRNLDLPKGLEETAAQLLATPPRRVDCGWLSYRDHQGEEAGRAFLNIASFGVSGLVDQLVNAGPKWMGGRPAFLLATLRANLRYRPAEVRLSVDGGEAVVTRIINLAVCNGQYFGGGMQIGPGASIDDGAFDVVTVEARSLLASGVLIPHLYDGKILDQPGVQHRRGTRVVAEPVDEDEHVLLDVDGEAPGRLPATFELKAQAIRLRG